MKLKKIIILITVGVLATGGALGVAAVRSAYAQSSAPVGPVGMMSDEARMGWGKPGRLPFGGISDEDLSAALGISVEDLRAAQEKAKEAALAQAVEAGLITQAQADELKANGSAFPFGGRWGAWLVQKGIDYDTLFAEALGISVEQLNQARTKAFNNRIDQAVTDGKLTQEQADLIKGQHALFSSKNFQSAMQSAFEEAVKKAVSEGVITQEQADLILAKIQTKGRFGFWGMNGFGPGRGYGMWGGPGFNPSAPSSPEAPANSGL